MPSADRRYHYGQAWVRLACCGLMILLAALIGGSYLLGMEKRADEIAQEKEGQVAEGNKPERNAEQKEFLNRYTVLWSAALVALMMLLLLAAYDLWAIRRYGLRHLRQLQEKRRGILKKELSLIRTQRNGHT